MFKIFRVNIFMDIIAHENFLPMKYFQTTVTTLSMQSAVNIVSYQEIETSYTTDNINN